MMAQSRAESTRDTYNYGQYINQFPPNMIKAIREYERIQKKICRQKICIMFNEIRIYIYIYIYIYKHVRLRIMDYFLFKIFTWSHSSLLVIFLMSGSRWWRKYPILAQALSTISLVIFGGCVRLFVAVSFIYIYLECFLGVFFFFFMGLTIFTQTWEK